MIFCETIPENPCMQGRDHSLPPPHSQEWYCNILQSFLKSRPSLRQVSFCSRSVYGVFQKNVKTRQGISLRRFVGPATELENATANPDNKGFCTPKTNCLPTGLLNISNCQIGVSQATPCREIFTVDWRGRFVGLCVPKVRVSAFQFAQR